MWTDTTTTMYLATTPSAVTKVVSSAHTILSLLTLLISYPQRWRKQDTSTQSPNWTSKYTNTFNLTPLHNRLTYRSTRTPPPTTAAPTPPSAQISPSQEPHHLHIIQTITANADHHLEMHEQCKLGCISNPATATSPPVHGDEIIGGLYNKNMVLIPIRIDPFTRFGPMFQSFLTSTDSHPQEPWFTTHRLDKFNRPYTNLMY
jgi:hypothetical protein